MGVRTILDEDDSALAAECGDPLRIERDVAADMDQPDRGDLMLVRGFLDGVEAETEILAIAVSKHHLAARLDDGKRRGHERIRGNQDLLAAESEVLHACHRPTRPARKRDS